ncbi:class I SAM-dependent methyltransferase [Streptomyces sp. CT34]|uniref:class I SAM-dependent methyltransferase n=1 Tax=Streptomyces sp. CT34 TaxID=1553907 RepID=UPI0005B8871D|nr:class I SAM-dependent methyltransferase [Streptomyces sp. CT34]
MRLPPLHVQPLTSPATVEKELVAMVAAHYDNEPLMRLAGEIHFDDELSDAETEAVVRVLDRPLTPLAYLPCCGTLRHARPLLERGAERVIAVDLSGHSLQLGLARNVPAMRRPQVAAFQGDVRNAIEVLPRTGADFAFMGGNSLGDITAPEGHLHLLKAIADSLAEDGVLVFDYVGDRYEPGPEDMSSEWPQVWHGVAGGGPGASAAAMRSCGRSRRRGSGRGGRPPDPLIP